MRKCDFHASIAFHALKCEINILIRFLDFTTMISEKEYYCNSITPILDNWSIAQVAEGRPIILLQ